MHSAVTVRAEEFPAEIIPVGLPRRGFGPIGHATKVLNQQEEAFHRDQHSPAALAVQQPLPINGRMDQRLMTDRTI
jgi:hypothetical protein